MPAPEGSPERILARRKLVANARAHRFIGYRADDWMDLCRDHYPELVDAAGEADLQAIANCEWTGRKPTSM